MKTLEAIAKWLLAVIIFLALALSMSGCTRYREAFTYLNADGTTNHVVDVSHGTFMVWGKAAHLKTETQTMEFYRTVNAHQLEYRPDAQAIGAIGDATGNVVGQALKSSAGIP